jgi:hypothetical protein
VGADRAVLNVQDDNAGKLAGWLARGHRKVKGRWERSEEND